MNTLIENLNALMTVKKELNKVLVDNEQPGGPVFDTYPEQFRELFRVLEDKIDDVEVGPYDTYQPETVVARPTIGFENNVVTLTCATQGAQIHFRTKDVYGNIQGDSNYVGRFSIRRDTYVETYAILNGIRSSEPDNGKWCYYVNGSSVPAPEFERTNGIVTITCRQQGAQIWWRIMPSTTFVLYTGPELVDGTKWLEAYAVYQGKGSETAISEGTEEGITVADPVLTCSDNIVTITCATEDAVIWYKTNLDDEWTVYTEPIEISVDTEFTAYAYKEGNISNTVTESFEYEEPYVPPVVTPADPVISCNANVVTITCSTTGATIYYSTDNGVTYNEYTGTITISADTTFYAYSELNGETSNTVSYEAQYEDSPQPVAPADPVISCTNNVVTITCSTTGAVIWYSTDGGNTYNIYTEPITISADTTFYTYSTKDGLTSNVVGPYYAEYLTAPAQPTVSVSNNEITITCSTEGATIYYCIVTSIYSTRNYVQYNSPIIFDASLYTPDNNVYLYTYSSKNGLDSKSYRYNILIPIPPVITNIYNEISITSTYSNYYGTIYYKINSEGTYTVYDKPFMINQACTIYAYVYTRWGVNSAVVEEIVEEISSVKFSPWITATYIKYDLPISTYNDFKGFYQLSNVKKTWSGSDNIRFVLDGEKLYIQLPDRTFIKDMKTSVTWTGLNAESHNTSTVIPSSSYSIRFGPGAPMWFWNMDSEQFTPGNTTDNNYTMSISSFTEGNIYVGNYSGTCTADFSVPKLDSTSNTTVYLSNMGQGFQKVITNYNQWSGGGDGQPIFDSQIRFEPFCKYNYSGSGTKNEYPFRFNNISTKINGVQFYSSTHNRYLYNGIGIVLNTASNQNI